MSALTNSVLRGLRLGGWTGNAGKGRHHSCNCIGPQSGQPLCPCAMRGVQIIEGRYVRVEDLGPAPVPSKAFTQEYSEFTRPMGDERKGE